MKRALLVLSLILMTVSLTAPFWSRLLNPSPSQRISGRVEGEFADHPWAGIVATLGTERFTIQPDGKFEFDVPPGVHVLRVCCSPKFEIIRREIEVKDKDLYVELHAEPLLEMPGRLIVPQGKELKSLAHVSARRIYSNNVKPAVISADGTFSLRLTKGQWKVDLENPNEGLTVKSITFGYKEIQNQTLTISKNQKPTLLEITLQ